MKKLQLVLIVLVCLLASCQKEDDTINVEGKISIMDATDTSLISAFEGVKVYLLQAPLVMDTIVQFFDESCILDIVLTDAEGKYSFGKLPQNDYIVLPADTSMNYRFEWVDSSDSIGIDRDNTQRKYAINFITKEPVAENDNYLFTFNYSGDYAPVVSSGVERGYYIQPFRTKRVAFGCGVRGSSPCGWYWTNIDEPGYDGRILTDSDVFSYTKDAGNFYYDFKNEFHFKIYSYTRTASQSGGEEAYSTEMMWEKTVGFSEATIKESNVCDIIFENNDFTVTIK